MNKVTTAVCTFNINLTGCVHGRLEVPYQNTNDEIMIFAVTIHHFKI